jgi:hypothetical protein
MTTKGIESTDTEMRINVIQILRSYKTAENEFLNRLERIDMPNPYSTSGKDYCILRDAWHKNFKRDYINFMRVLSAFKTIPKVGETKEYISLEKYFNKFNDDYLGYCLRMILETPKKFQKLLSYVKTKFQITETDLIDEEVLNPKNPTLDNTKSNAVKIEPKHIKELHELEAIQKELTSVGFLKRQVDVVRDVMKSASKYVGYILQTELFEGNLTEENREFINSTNDIKKKLKNMAGSVQLDDTTEAIIREYSFELNSFIKRQKENRGLV